LSKIYASKCSVYPINLRDIDDFDVDYDGGLKDYIGNNDDDYYVIIVIPSYQLELVQGWVWEQMKDLSENEKIFITMAYLLGNNEYAHDYLESCWEVGFGSVTDRAVAILNEYYGDIEDFYWVDSLLRREGWCDMYARRRSGFREIGWSFR